MRRVRGGMQVEIKAVFPRLALHGTALNLQEIDTASGKWFQSLGEHSRTMRKREYEREFIGVGRDVRFTCQHDEPRVVFRIIFEMLGEYFAAIHFRCTAASNGGYGEVVLLNYASDA